MAKYRLIVDFESPRSAYEVDCAMRNFVYDALANYESKADVLNYRVDKIRKEQ